MKKYAYRVYVTESLSGFEGMLLPVEAMVLTLLTGEESKEELVAAMGGFLRCDAEKAADYVDKVFEKCATCMDITGKIEFVPRYRQRRRRLR
jgi:hypothetical protein